jgi:IS5 family transposase
MKQFGLFDYHKSLSRVNKTCDSLVEQNQVVEWEQFRFLINRALEKPRKSPAGTKCYDPSLLFKILIFQSLYDLSDETKEYQILNRYLFSRFLCIREGSKVHDATTIFRFRDELTKARVVELLFT